MVHLVGGDRWWRSLATTICTEEAIRMLGNTLVRPSDLAKSPSNQLRAPKQTQIAGLLSFN